MKKMFLILLTLVMVLAALSMPALAGPPNDEVEGLWQYQPFIKVYNADGECVPPTGDPDEVPCIEFHNDNMFMQTFENGEWSGTFDGVSTEDGKVVAHSSGFWSFNAIVSFEGQVDGRSGTLKMSVVGKAPDAFSDWEGKWVILSGTDELATLRGRGTWWGPGAPDVGLWGDIYYDGQIHFEP